MAIASGGKRGLGTLRTTNKESLIRTSNVWLWLFAIVFATQLSAEPKWVTYQSARLVIGQSSFTRSEPVATVDDPVSKRGVLGAVGGVAVGGDVLVVTDANRIGATPNNNRVLVYNNLSDFIPEPEAEFPQGDDCSVCVGLPDLVLGQPDFETRDAGTLDGAMKAPTGIATDGQRLAVADSNNNRVLLWHSIPANNGTPPDVVLGQADLTDNTPRTSADGMRGPQGVWIDSGRLFVADTSNGRVLIWNSFPSSNGQAADVVVGQPDFDTQSEIVLDQEDYPPTSQRMLDPVSISVAAGKMIVTDFGFSRVLIYLSIPLQNNAAADVVVGQPDFETAGIVRSTDPGNSLDENLNIIDSEGRVLHDGTGARLARGVVALCEQIGQFDDDGTVTPDNNRFPTRVDRGESVDDDDNVVGPEGPEMRWPKRCGYTLNFPRFALSDGTRLFVADSGNDRVMIYDEIPTENGVEADAVIGQPDFIALTDSDGAGNLRTPTSLAHDGQNLYVADPLQRRVLVFTPGEDMIALDGIRNGASFDVKANGFLLWSGVATSEQTATVEISGQVYRIDDAPTDTTAGELRDQFVAMINDREDTLVTASPINGPGTLSRAVIDFSGSTRAGDIITLRIRDRGYSVEMLGPPFDTGPETAIDRLVFAINEAGGDPEVVVRRTVDFIERMEVVSKVTGTAANRLPVSIEIPEGSPLIGQFVDQSEEPPDLDGIDSGRGTLTGETEGVLSGGDFPALAWLAAVEGGRPGNAITIQNRITGSTAGTIGISVRTSGGRLTGGSDARFLPPGTFATMFGDGFSEQNWIASSEDGSLPTELGGVTVYVNGILAPISSVFPTQINFQVPWEVVDDITVTNTGTSTYVRRRMDDGAIVVSVPRANHMPSFAPGLFAMPGPEPRQAVAVHATEFATGEVALTAPSSDEDENVPGGATITITVANNDYSYTSLDSDTLDSVRDGLIAVINSGDGDPNVTAAAGQLDFFSARADVDIGGEPREGDVVSIFIGGGADDGEDDGDSDTRIYTHLVEEGDNTETIRNLLIQSINSGGGDPQVTAQEINNFGRVGLRIIARELGAVGNSIAFSVSASDGAGVEVLTEQDQGFLERGATTPGVLLTARVGGKEGNEIAFSAASDDEAALDTTVRAETLCCGNVPFSLITEENPAVPGETITLFGSGLGFTAPLPATEGLTSGQPTPPAPPLFEVPFEFANFVSSRVGTANSSARVQFVGLMPGFVGIYQINLTIFEGLPENPLTPISIAQRDFTSNTVMFAVKPLQPTNP